jgi:hypothetical protein
MNDVAEINRLHNEAMASANEAYAADLKGDFEAAERNFREAFESESKAALLLKDRLDAEPSRSVLFRSAATLGIDCGEFREAERLISFALAGNPPDDLCDELRDALEKVHFSRHLSLRGVDLDPGEFQMSLTGSSVGFGVIEGSQFLRRADDLEKLLVRNAERMRGMPFRENGAPNPKSLQGFEVFYSVPRAASFAISVRLGRPQRQQMLPTFVGVQNVVDDFLETIEQFNDGKGDEVRRRFDSDAYFNNFRALVKRLAPDGQKINNVGFTSIRGEERREASLTHPVDPAINRIEDETRVMHLVGKIRKADETKRGDPIFGIEDGLGKVRHVSVPAGLLNDIVKPYWGELVKVIARQLSPKKLELIDLEPLTDSTNGDAE